MGCPAAARGARRRRAAVPVLGRPALEPGGVGGREDRGLPDVLHEPAVPAERRAQQHRHAGPQAGGHQAPAAGHGPVSAVGSRGARRGWAARGSLGRAPGKFWASCREWGVPGARLPQGREVSPPLRDPRFLAAAGFPCGYPLSFGSCFLVTPRAALPPCGAGRRGKKAPVKCAAASLTVLYSVIIKNYIARKARKKAERLLSLKTRNYPARNCVFCYQVFWNIQLGTVSFCVLLRILGLLSCLSTLSFLRQTNGSLAFLPISTNWDC